jgi:Ras-related GTP-binding protein A/B
VNIKKYFATSIWDESLYQAWSSVVQQLIPNRKFIKNTLQNLCEISLCNEAVLFERETFLILSQHHESGKEDLITCEKVANIIKQFKLTCK